MQAVRGAVFSLVLMLLSSGAASAAIIGQQFTAEYRYPDLSTPYGPSVFVPTPFTAHAGLDTTGTVEGVTDLLVDLFDYGVTVTFITRLTELNPTWNAAAFNGIVLTAAGLLGVSNPTVDPSSTFGGFEASRVTLTSNEIQLNWNGLTYHNGEFLTVSFASSVPEPASLALFCAAIAGLGAMRRRAKA